jgi:crotonobetainyl-CoA:carnitine CoA-transferase CaiB-like acyl-CoA transferase
VAASSDKPAGATSPSHTGAPSGAGTLGYSRGAPGLGQHTAEVLREAGLSDAEIEDLATRGVVAG